MSKRKSLQSSDVLLRNLHLNDQLVANKTRNCIIWASKQFYRTFTLLAAVLLTHFTIPLIANPVLISSILSRQSLSDGEAMSNFNFTKLIWVLSWTIFSLTFSKTETARPPKPTRLICQHNKIKLIFSFASLFAPSTTRVWSWAVLKTNWSRKTLFLEAKWISKAEKILRTICAPAIHKKHKDETMHGTLASRDNERL